MFKTMLLNSIACITKLYVLVHIPQTISSDIIKLTVIINS